MIRYTLFILAIVGTAATAIANVNHGVPSNPKNVTVIMKNDVYPMIGAITVEKCALENCSDTPSNS